MLVSNQSELLPNLIGGDFAGVIDVLLKLLFIVVAVFVILTWQNVTQLKTSINNFLDPSTPPPNSR
jgi:hypothetical protein